MKVLLFILSAAAAAAADSRNGQRRSQASASSCVSIEDCGTDYSRFCGTGGQCYDFSCHNWYKFGNWSGTSPDIVSATSLTCGDYTTGEEDDMHAVIYGCSRHQPGNKIPLGQGISQAFNQKCYADLGNLTFECYYLDQDTNFSIFLHDAETLFVEKCTDGTTPAYINVLALATPEKVVLAGISDEEFYPDTALAYSMYATVSVSSGAGSFLRFAASLAVAVAVTSLLLA